MTSSLPTDTAARVAALKSAASAVHAATAARAVALTRLAEALVGDTSRLDAAQQAYEGGLAAEMGKWPSWVKFAETMGVKAEDLNYSASDKAQVDSFKSALDGIMDMVLRGPHDAWTSSNLAATREQEKQHRKAGRIAEADACKREAQSAATRRTELGNVIRYGAIVGRYVLDRMTQERELAGVHKATVWAAVFSNCNRKCADIREAGGTITEGDLYSVAAAVLDGNVKPEKTDDEKRSTAAANLNKALGKASELNILSVAEVRAIRNILDKNPQTQERATDEEAAVKPVTRASKAAPAAPAAPAAKGKGKGKSANKPVAAPPRKASEQTTPRTKAELKAETARDDAATRAAVEKNKSDAAKIAADVI